MAGTDTGLSTATVSISPTPTIPRAQQIRERWKVILFSAIIVAAVVAVYYPVHAYPFLSDIDDGTYVLNNEHVLAPLSWDSVGWAFTHSYVLNYDPLTFLGHSINVRLFGLNGGAHHDVNVFLHAFNALLLFWVLRRTTGATGRSFMVAALFAAHPINVENVAWISELKTLLSTLFFISALGAYLWYAHRPRLWRMLAVTFLFGLGLLAKPQVIAFPLVLLLWDYWPLRRISLGHDADIALDSPPKPGRLPEQTIPALLIEKIPLFLAAILDVLLTLHSERKTGLETYTFLIRAGTAVRSYVIYVGKAFWPANLAFNYAHPGYGLRWSEVTICLIVLVLISVFVIVNRSRRYLVVGWLWFLVTMLPTINLIQIDLPAVADRYAYISFIGLFLMVCWGATDLVRENHLPSTLLQGAGIVVLIALAALGAHQLRYWKTTDALFIRSLEVSPGSWWAERAVGAMLLQEGRPTEGLPLLYRALEKKPKEVSVMTSIAFAEHQAGHFQQAISMYQRILAVTKSNPEKAQLYANMGHDYSNLGDTTDALQCYREAQRLRLPVVP